MNNNGNKKEDKNVIKYAISILVVAMICIAIGGISMSRTINRGDGRIMDNFNVENKAQLVSEENLRLKNENENLKKDIKELTEKAVKAENEKKEAERLTQGYKLYSKYLQLEDKESEEAKQILFEIQELGFRTDNF